MSTPNYLFMGFVTLGILFFFVSCLSAARPASGTTEWINYKCRRKLTFCPAPKPLTKFDLIPISALTIAAFGVMLLTAAYFPKLDSITPLSQFLELSLFKIGNGHFYLSQLLWVMSVPLMYILLKNITGGYFIPVCGSVLMMMDIPSLILSHNTGTTAASLFVLAAIYLAYRYTTLADNTTLSRKIYLFLAIGVSLGIGAAFSASAFIAIIGIIAVYTVKEIFIYLDNKEDNNSELKKQILKRTAIFAPCILILPLFICISVTMLCTIGKFATFADSIANAFGIIANQLSFNGNIYSITMLATLGPMVFVSGIFALPCCIYQAAKAKDGASLFAIIPLAVYILNVIVFGFSGLLPIFAIPIITQCFAALHNRKLKYWILAYLFTATLYIGFLITITLV